MLIKIPQVLTSVVRFTAALWSVCRPMRLCCLFFFFMVLNIIHLFIISNPWFKLSQRLRFKCLGNVTCSFSGKNIFVTSIWLQATVTSRTMWNPSKTDSFLAMRLNHSQNGAVQCKIAMEKQSMLQLLRHRGWQLKPSDFGDGFNVSAWWSLHPIVVTSLLAVCSDRASESLLDVIQEGLLANAGFLCNFAWNQPLFRCLMVAAFFAIVMLPYWPHFAKAFIDVDEEEAICAIFKAQWQQRTKIAAQEMLVPDTRRLVADGYVLDGRKHSIRLWHQSSFSTV